MKHATDWSKQMVALMNHRYWFRFHYTDWIPLSSKKVSYKVKHKFQEIEIGEALNLRVKVNVYFKVKGMGLTSSLMEDHAC